jgi:hypothetical protein
VKAQFQAGDVSSSSCRACRKIVRTRYEVRTVLMPGTRLRVPNVLVDVCTECDTMVSIPRQSIPQLREGSVWK